MHHMRFMGRAIYNEECLHAQVQIPEKLEQQLKAGMKEAGIPIPETEERWNQAMNALKVCFAPGKPRVCRSTSLVQSLIKFSLQGISQAHLVLTPSLQHTASSADLAIWEASAVTL